MSRAAAEVGSTANSYQILAKLATGGMAEIFLARGKGVAELERYCVLKRILRDRASDVQFVRMFLDEARLAAQLQHPNIAQVYDIGKLGDSYFFTMEYVHGETVRELLHRAQAVNHRLPIASVLTIVAGAAAGLHHAHERLGLGGRPLGIVHRDVSPSNLMVSYEGGVKVVDFGVAKAADRADETKTGTVKGKISYLSPEQCKGRRVDRRSDLFSLGICFWEMLTTERLYKRSSDFENMNAIVGEPPPPPSSRRPDVPREIDGLVLRLLAKSPDDRFQTAEQVVDALEQVAARTGSVLSASALGRFLRALIGRRPEPWLELASHREQGEAVTVASEPIPPELAAAQVDAVDAQLSSVLDLSSARSVHSVHSTQSVHSMYSVTPERVATESLKSLDGLGALPAEPTMRLGRPLFMPPPTPLRLSPAIPALTMPDAGRSRSLHATDSVFLMASADVATAASGERMPPERRPTGTPVVMGAADAHAAGPPSGTVSAIAGVFAAPSAEQPVLAGPATALRPRRRARWPYAAACAALIGAVAVVLAMRAAAVGSMPIAEPMAGARSSSPSITVVPIPDREPTGSASAAVGSGGDPASAPTTGSNTRPAGDRASSAVAASSVGRPTGDRASLTVAAGSGGKPSGDSPVRAAAGAVDARPGVRGGAEPPRRGAAPAVRARISPRSAEPPAPDRAEPPVDPIARAFAERSYDTVLAACGTGPVTAEHASLCVMAACNLGDEPKARQRLSAVAAAGRAGLIDQCKQLGVELAVKKPVDCDADPMACPR